MSTADGIAFDRLCRIVGLPLPVPEYKFALALGRQWRFDWAWPKHRIALEVEGGHYKVGRHQRPAGFVEDMHKYNAAALDGWLVLRVIPKDLQSTTTLDMVRKALEQRRRG
jgi:hypothetical protein